MRLKKGFTVTLVFMLIVSLLTACTTAPSQETSSSAISESRESATEAPGEPLAGVSEKADIVVRVGLLKGPSSLGMLGLMDNNEQKKSAFTYDFTIAGAPQDIQARLLNGELDIAAIPTNLAAALYNKTDKSIKTVAVGTLGVLYLLSRDENISSLAELEGKTVYATGQGAINEYVLAYLLDENGLADKVDVEFKGEHSELAALMAAGEVEIAMLPQPFVTTVTSNNPDVRVAVDLNDEWRNATNGKELVMTCIVVRNEFLNENKAVVDEFLNEYKESTEFLNANVDEAAVLSEKFDIIPEAVAKKAIPKCNVVYIAGSAMKASANPVLEVLFAANPQSVGGALPDDAFYYEG